MKPDVVKVTPRLVGALCPNTVIDTVRDADGHPKSMMLWHGEQNMELTYPCACAVLTAIVDWLSEHGLVAESGEVFILRDKLSLALALAGKVGGASDAAD